MDPQQQQLLDVLAHESIAQRISVPAVRPGPLVDQLVLTPPEHARAVVLRRENERLVYLFDEHSRTVALAGASALNQYLADRVGFAIFCRKRARCIAETMPQRQQTHEPLFVRLGYHGVLGAKVVLLSPINGLLSSDVFPRSSGYLLLTERCRVTRWADINKGRIQFSLELEGEVEKVVFAP